MERAIARLFSLAAKAFAAISRLDAKALFDLLSQNVLVQVLPNQHELIFQRPTVPLFVFQRKPFAAEVKNMTLRALIKP